MPPVGIYQGVVDRNDETGVWVKINLGANQSDELPTAALIVTQNATAPDGTQYTVGPNVTNGAQVLVDFQEANLGRPVILGNYTSASVVPWQSVAPGGVVATHQYTPTSGQTYGLTTSLAAIDATNLTISFVAPGSGSVLLGANIYGRTNMPASVGYETAVCLRFVTHGTTTAVSPQGRFLDTNTSSAQLSGHCNYLGLVGGLVPGAAYQYDLAGLYATTAPSGTSATLYVGNGSANGFSSTPAAILTVSAA